MIQLWLKLWEINRPYKVRFLIGILFGIVSGSTDLLVLVTVGFVFGAVFTGNQMDAVKIALDQFDKKHHWMAELFIKAQAAVSPHVQNSKTSLLLLVALIPLVILVRGVCNYLNNYLMAWVTNRGICDLRANVFDHLMNLPLGFLAKHSTGELMSRIGDVGILQSMMGTALVTMVKEPVNIIALASGAYYVQPRLTVITLVMLAVCAYPIAIFNRKVRKAGAAIQTEAANLNKMMHESFTGNRIIKGYNLEQVVMDRFRATQRKFISQAMRAVRASETPGPLMEFLGATGLAILLYSQAGAADPTKFGIFAFAIVSIYRPIKAVIRTQSQLQQAQAATARVFELLATKSNLVESPNPRPLQAAGADIAFDRVSFNYGDKPVLKNISLRVEAGRLVALVGSSGAGKSTLTNLLLRFYDPTQGSITIGGTDLREFALANLRSQIAVVTQEVILFNDTIRQNIAYGRPAATDEEIQQAARHAFAHDFIVNKPNGYDSLVGERGVTLSGGERQRLAIARAILKNAPILVLDEATSSLDNESERMVQAALDQLMRNRTTICIAHRLSTIRHADLILVLDHGEIAEQGRHEELLARGGIYHKLHALGFRPEDAKA